MQLKQQIKDMQAEQKKREEQMSAANAIQTEQLLSGQLREMTQVLDEFDQKFTRKEKQLEAFRTQNKQMKEAYDTVKEMQIQLQQELFDTRNELACLQQSWKTQNNKLLEKEQALDKKRDTDIMNFEQIQ